MNGGWRGEVGYLLSSVLTRQDCCKETLASCSSKLPKLCAICVWGGERGGMVVRGKICSKTISDFRVEDKISKSGFK